MSTGMPARQNVGAGDRTLPRPGRGPSWKSAAGRRTRSSSTASTGSARDGIELVHGPGCPVCVTSLEMIDRAHAIALAARRHLLLVRRHAARAGLSRRPLAPEVAGEPTCGSSIRRSMPSESPQPIRSDRSSSSPSASRPPLPPTPWPSDQAQRLGMANFSRAGLPRARAPRHQRDPAITREPRPGLSRTWSCLHRHGIAGVRADRADVSACPSSSLASSRWISSRGVQSRAAARRRSSGSGQSI